MFNMRAVMALVLTVAGALFAFYFAYFFNVFSFLPFLVGVYLSVTVVSREGDSRTKVLAMIALAIAGLFAGFIIYVMSGVQHGADLQ